MLFHVHAQMLPHVVVEAAQDVLAAIDERHVRAEAGKNAGELDRDVAAALDHHVRRQLRQMERLVRGDGVLDAGDRIAIARRAAGGDQDIGRAHAIAVRQLHRMGVGEHGAAFDDGDAGLLQRRGVGRLEPRDLA